MLRRYSLLGALTLATDSLLFAAEQRKPLVERVDHFCLVSEDSERLFQFFRDEFKSVANFMHRKRLTMHAV
jgi:hypothetical protein